MNSSSPEAIHRRIRDKENFERADLRDLTLSHTAFEGTKFCRSDLEGADLEGANLRHADLAWSNLQEAYMQGIDLERANLQNANLENANLEGANLQFADLRRANLRGASLEGANLKEALLSYVQADFANLGRALLSKVKFDNASMYQIYLGGADLTNANLRHARMVETNLEDAKLIGADLTEAVLTHALSEGVDFANACLRGADFENASLVNSNLNGADLRNCRFSNAQMRGAILTGAKVFGIEVVSADLAGVQADWVDVSAEGNGRQRVAGSELVEYTQRFMAGLDRISATDLANPKRYFGQGDVLRHATLEFSDNSLVEFESYLENCTIYLGHGSRLIVGVHGILAGCQIIGSGDIVILGLFDENGTSPGIIGPRSVHVGATGTVISVVEQIFPLTEFGFERGCSLSLNIRKCSHKGENDVRESNYETNGFGRRNGV